MNALAVEGEDKHIEIWKIKKLIHKLKDTKGNGTFFVSLYIPPKSSIILAA